MKCNIQDKVFQVLEANLEEEVMSVVQVSRKSNFDLVVEGGAGLVVEDARVRVAHERTRLALGARVRVDGRRAREDEPQRPARGGLLVRVAQLDMAAEVARARKVGLVREVERERVQVHQVLVLEVRRTQRHVLVDEIRVEQLIVMHR